MKKLNPLDTKSRFDAAIVDLRATMAEVDGLRTRVSSATRKLLVESAVLAAAVRWEVFVSDLFIAYINRDPSKLKAHHRARLQAKLKNEFGDVLGGAMRLHLPKHLVEADVRAIVDKDDRNLSFRDAEAMNTRADNWLPEPAVSRFKKLTTVDRTALKAWVAVRHFLAHRSLSSCKTMNDALIQKNLDSRLRRGKQRVEDVGAHFEATPPGGQERRVFTLFDVMRAVAGKL